MKTSSPCGTACRNCTVPPWAFAICRTSLRPRPCSPLWVLATSASRFSASSRAASIPTPSSVTVQVHRPSSPPTVTEIWHPLGLWTMLLRSRLSSIRHESMASPQLVRRTHRSPPDPPPPGGWAGGRIPAWWPGSSHPPGFRRPPCLRIIPACCRISVGRPSLSSLHRIVLEIPVAEGGHMGAGVGPGQFIGKILLPGHRTALIQKHGPRVMLPHMVGIVSSAVQTPDRSRQGERVHSNQTVFNRTSSRSGPRSISEAPLLFSFWYGHFTDRQGRLRAEFFQPNGPKPSNRSRQGTRSPVQCGVVRGTRGVLFFSTEVSNI